MSGNPREHVGGKGFWDGGAPGHSHDDQTAGRPSGFPGVRKPKRVGVRTDLEFPPEAEAVEEK
jgi:hypothetical protein